MCSSFIYFIFLVKKVWNGLLSSINSMAALEKSILPHFHELTLFNYWDFPVGLWQLRICLQCRHPGSILGLGRSPERDMAAHSSKSWFQRIPPGQRSWRAIVLGVANVRHDWATNTHNILYAFLFLSQGQATTSWQMAEVKCYFVTTESAKIRGKLRTLPSNNSLVKHIACSLGREESTSTQMSQREVIFPAARYGHKGAEPKTDLRSSAHWFWGSKASTFIFKNKVARQGVNFP